MNKMLNKMKDYETKLIKESAEHLSIENERLQERIDEAIKYITSEEYFFLNNPKTGSYCEDCNNYMKAHDKLLEILKGE